MIGAISPVKAFVGPVALAALTLAAFGCAEENGENATPTVAPTAVSDVAYRVVLASPGGELPFYVLAPGGGSGAAKLINGEEVIEVAFTREGASMKLDFPHYDSWLTLEAQSGEGTFAGSWTRYGSGGEYETMEATAALVGWPDPTARFGGGLVTEVDAGRPDYSGEWKMAFVDDGPAKGVFTQSEAGVVRGTVMTPIGDHRFLAGNVIDDELFLSTFDGAHAFVYRGTLDESGSLMTGTFWSRMAWEDPFTAERVGPGSYELADAFQETVLLSSDGGLKIGRLSEAPYAGAPIVVQLFGTWCPNCNEEASVLKRFYDEYRSDGLQMLSLAFEFGEDAERIERQVARFKERYNVDWETIWTGPSDKEAASKLLPELSQIKSWPTTIFVNRDGSVEAIHTGFAGEATGEAHEELLAEFDRLIRKIVGPGATG